VASSDDRGTPSRGSGQAGSSPRIQTSEPNPMVELNPSKDDFTTVIGADAQFKGELTFQGGVRIDGQLEGTVQTPGRILVTKGGKLKAEVKAGTIAVEGQVDGN